MCSPFLDASRPRAGLFCARLCRNDHSDIAHRVSYSFDFRSPSLFSMQLLYRPSDDNADPKAEQLQEDNQAQYVLISRLI